MIALRNIILKGELAYELVFIEGLKYLSSTMESFDKSFD